MKKKKKTGHDDSANLRKRAEKALRENLERFQLAIQATYDAIWDWNLQTDALWWNENFQTLFGYGAEEIEPGIESWTNRIHPEDRDRVKTSIHAAIASGQEHWFDQYRFRRKDGMYAEVEDRGYIARDASGQPARMIGAMRDNTERIRSEEKLRKSEEKYRGLTENINLGIYRNTVGPEGEFIEANPAIIGMFGYKSKEEFLGINVSDLYQYSEDREHFNNKMLKEGFVRGEELWLKKRDGSPFFGSVSAVTVKDGQGHVMYYDGIIEDITERKRAEEALLASESRYRQLVENASEAIIVVQDGLLKFVNRATVEMISYSEPELIARPISEFLHPDDREMVMDHYRRRLAGETDQSRYVFRSRTREGGVKWVEIGAVLIDWEGRPATLNFLTDVTDRHKGEEAIQASLQEKEVLLREIHHRVKNNMQVISSLFNLQAGHTLNEGYRAILKEAQTRIRTMSLVHEKLYQAGQLSRIDFGGYINSLALHLIHVYRPQPGLVQLETEFEDVTLDIASAMPCGLLLNELISNALKHAFPENWAGVLRIALKRGTAGLIEIRVADDGVGFPEDLDFAKAESFGLQIVNLLVRQLDATIELDRTNGTAFTVTFRELKYASRA